MSSLSSGGGGGAIYKDGGALTQAIQNKESITVPSDETWVFRPSAGYNGTEGKLKVGAANELVNGRDDPSQGFPIVAKSGTTIKETVGGVVLLSGWVL